MEELEEAYADAANVEEEDSWWIGHGDLFAFNDLQGGV